MLKKHELANPTSCLNKAAPDEPVFVLRAKDPFAAQTVRLWAAMSEGHHEGDKIHEALKLASEMEEWLEERMPKSILPQTTPGLRRPARDEHKLG